MKACCCTQWGVVSFIWVTKHFVTSHTFFLQVQLQVQWFWHLFKAVLFSFCIGFWLLHTSKQAAFYRGRPTPLLYKHTWMRRADTVLYKQSRTHRHIDAHTLYAWVHSQQPNQHMSYFSFQKPLPLPYPPQICICWALRLGLILGYCLEPVPQGSSVQTHSSSSPFTPLKPTPCYTVSLKTHAGSGDCLCPGWRSKQTQWDWRILKNRNKLEH